MSAKATLRKEVRPVAVASRQWVGLNGVILRPRLRICFYQEERISTQDSSAVLREGLVWTGPDIRLAEERRTWVSLRSIKRIKWKRRAGSESGFSFQERAMAPLPEDHSHWLRPEINRWLLCSSESEEEEDRFTRIDRSIDQGVPPPHK
ncbi:hypothetical protein SKAU_G00181230 [Synaphobranchus kaupii]|uniref:Uncharacterized protein n=1 Tax=Synaphobranchus kaupii TaxID=118154 RepID=A0A9Q1FM84_SYNKA|nr:hypothetical protein SKAU_G00181230 [Synaphobranchus kaupii]